MSESTLSITKTVIDQALGRDLGFGTDKTKWSAGALAIVDRARRAGLQLFYNPPALPGQRLAHAWRFLRPVGELTVWADVDATMSGVPVYTTTSLLTATTAVFYPTMVGFNLVFDTSGNSYPIATYVSSTQVTLTGDASGETSGDGFIITATGDYQMPDNFGVAQSDLTFPASAAYHPPIPIIGEQTIRERRGGTLSRGVPSLAAIVPKATTGLSGQRWTLQLWPIPSAVYVLSLRYDVRQDDLVDTTNEYPWGGQAHSQTIEAACLAAAEKQEKGGYGSNYQDFLVKLGASISQDVRGEARVLGENRDRSDDAEGGQGHRVSRPTVTYNGVPI